MVVLKFTLPDGGALQPDINRLFMAGYTGRSEEAVKRHIAEMAQKGVSPPTKTPAYHPVMPCLLSQSQKLEVCGRDTLPEVEFVIFGWQGRLFVTVGNDQYDVEMERVGELQRSKNLAQKPISKFAWPLEDVEDHWDELQLKMYAGGILVQSGPVSEIMRPESLVSSASITDGTMVFSGTVPFVAPLDDRIDTFVICLTDPVKGRALTHEFKRDVVEEKVEATTGNRQRPVEATTAL